MSQMSTKKTSQALALLAAALLMPGTLQAGAKKWEKIPSPRLRDIPVPAVQRYTLDNGVQLFVLEDHELPLFRLSLGMDGGSAMSPKEKLGLAEITAAVLRSGGSETLPGDTMDGVLEGMGGSIETEVDALTASVNVNVLIEDADKALGMLADLLLHPAYPQDKLDLEIKQWKSGIARRNDDPMGIADREIDKILYGREHPFVAQVEYEDLARIHKRDLVDFHGRYYHPAHAFLAVWGDFDTKDIVQRIGAAIGGWPKADVQLPPIPDVPATVPSVNLVTKESVNQSSIRIGHRGTTAKDPDYYALSVMNEILGGSFGSRLFNEVRSRQGLAYNVGSGLGAGLLYPGMFTVRCGTKSESTVKAVRACIEEVRKMKTQAITPEELERAKSGILNSHVFNFANRGAIVNRQVAYARFGYPPDFLEQYAKRIEQVSVEDVKRAADKYLHPDQMAVLVVGKPADFGEPLGALGDVKPIDITIPQPPVTEEFAAPTAETLARGKTILAEAARAVGGVDNLRKVSSLTQSSDVVLTMMGQSLQAKATRWVRYPEQYRYDIEIMGQKMVQVYDGANRSGFQRGPGGVKDFEADDIEDARSEAARDLLQYLRDPDPYSPQWLGDADVNGAQADVVLLSPQGLDRFKVYVDRKTHLVLKLEHQGKNFQGAPVHEEQFLEDYRKVGPFLLPHTVRVNQDGQPFLSSQATSFAWDPIPPDRFAKTQS